MCAHFSLKRWKNSSTSKKCLSVCIYAVRHGNKFLNSSSHNINTASTHITSNINNLINKIHERSLRISYKDQKTSYHNLLGTHNELTIHQRNLQVLMTEIYKIVNGVAPPIMNSLFEFRSNEYNIRNFQVLSTDFRRTVNYGIETITYRAPSIWAKLPSEYKFAASLDEFKVKIKK